MSSYSSSYMSLNDDNEESVSRNALLQQQQQQQRRPSDQLYDAMENNTQTKKKRANSSDPLLSNYHTQKQRKTRTLMMILGALTVLLVSGGCIYWFMLKGTHTQTQTERDNAATNELFHKLSSNIDRNGVLHINTDTLNNKNFTKSLKALTSSESLMLTNAKVNLLDKQVDNHIVIQATGASSLYTHDGDINMKLYYLNNSLSSFMIMKPTQTPGKISDMLMKNELPTDPYGYIGLSDAEYHVTVGTDNSNVQMVGHVDTTNTDKTKATAVASALSFVHSDTNNHINGDIVGNHHHLQTKTTNIHLTVNGTLKPKLDLSIGIVDAHIHLGKYVSFTNLTIGVSPAKKNANISAIMHITPPNVDEMQLYMLGDINVGTHEASCNLTQIGDWNVPGVTSDVKLSALAGDVCLQFTNDDDSTHVSIKSGVVSAGVKFGALTSVVQFALPPPVATTKTNNNTIVPFAFEVLFDDTINIKSFPNMNSVGFPSTNMVKSAIVFSSIGGLYHFIHPQYTPVSSLTIKPGFNFIADVKMHESTSVSPLASSHLSDLIVSGDVSRTNNMISFDLSSNLTAYEINKDITLNNLSINLHYPAVNVLNEETYVSLTTNFTIDLPSSSSFAPMQFGAAGIVGPDILHLEGQLSTNLQWNITIGEKMEVEIRKVYGMIQHHDKEDTWAGVIGGVFGWNHIDTMIQLQYPYDKDGKHCVDFEILQVTDVTIRTLIIDFVPSLKNHQTFTAPSGVVAAILNTSIDNVELFISPTCGNISLTGQINTVLFGKANIGLFLYKNVSNNQDHWHFNVYAQPASDWKITDSSVIASGFPKVALFGCTFILSSHDSEITIPVNTNRVHGNITLSAQRGLDIHAFIDEKNTKSSFMNAFKHMFPNETVIEVYGHFGSNGWSVSSGLIGNEHVDLGHGIILEKAYVNISHTHNDGDELMMDGEISTPNPFNKSHDRILFIVNSTLKAGEALFEGTTKDANMNLSIPIPIMDLSLEYLVLSVNVTWPTTHTNGSAVALSGFIDGALLFNDEGEIILELDLFSSGAILFNGTIVDDPPLTFGDVVEKLCGSNIWKSLNIPSSLSNDIKNIWAFDSGNIELKTKNPTSLNGSLTMDVFKKVHTDAVLHVFESTMKTSQDSLELTLGIDIGVGNFSTIIPDIKQLDTFPLTGVAVALATTSDSIQFPRSSVPYLVQPGFNYLAELSLADSGIFALEKVHQYTGISSVDIFGVISTTKFTLHGDIEGDVHVWIFHLNSLGLKLVIDTQVMVGIEMRTQVDLSSRDQDHLQFYGDLMVGDEGFRLDASMTNDWTDPFGVKGVTLKECLVSLELSWDIVPVEAGIAGGLYIDGIGADAGVYIDQDRQLLYANFGKFNLQNIVDGILHAAGVAKPANIVQIISDLKLDGASFYINDADGPVVFNGQTFPPGVYFSVQGFELWELIKGNASILISDTQMNLDASLDAIHLLDDKIVFSGAYGPDSNANMSLHVGSTGISVLEFSGGVKIFNEFVDAAMDLEDSVWSLYVNMSLFDELFNFSLAAYCKKTLNAPTDFSLDFEFNQEVLDYISDEVPKKLNQSYQTESAQVAEWQADIDKHLANLTSIQKQIDKIKAEDQKILDPLVKRLHDAQADVAKKQGQVNSLQSKIDEYKDKIKHLKWYNKWKAVGYGAAIAALEVAKGTADAALATAKEFLKLCEKAVDKAKDIDPRVLALEAEYGIEHAALEAAKTLLAKGEEVYATLLKLIEKLAGYAKKAFNIEEADVKGSLNSVLSGDFAQFHLKGIFLDHNINITVDIDVHLLESLVESVWKGVLEVLHIDQQQKNAAPTDEDNDGGLTEDERLAQELLLP